MVEVENEGIPDISFESLFVNAPVDSSPNVEKRLDRIEEALLALQAEVYKWNEK